MDLQNLGLRRTLILTVGTPSALGEVLKDGKLENLTCSNEVCSHICVTLKDQRERRSKFECLCPIGYSKAGVK